MPSEKKAENSKLPDWRQSHGRNQEKRRLEDEKAARVAEREAKKQVRVQEEMRKKEV